MKSKSVNKQAVAEADAQLLDRLLASGKLGALLKGIGVFVKDFSSGAIVPNTLWKELGHPIREMRGEGWKRFIHPEDRGRVDEYMRSLTSGFADAWEGEYRIRAKDGVYHTIKHRALVLERNAEGVPTLFIGWDQDLTRYAQRLEDSLRVGEDHRRRFLRSEEIRTAGAILASELDSKDPAERMLYQAGRVISFDAAEVRAIEDGESFRLASLGFSDDGAVVDKAFSVLSPEEGAPRTPMVFSPDLGPYRSILIVPLLRRDKIVGYIDFYTRRPQAYGREEQGAAMLFAEQAEVAFSNALRYKATELEASTDWLTGLPTRRAFMARAGRYTLEAPRDLPLSAMMIDIDFFKKVNDNYGHLVGDLALVAIASSCREALRSEDISCRYGGEEFVVLLPGADERVARAAGERIRKRIEDVRLADYPGLRFTVSIGICSETNNVDFREIIAKADEALYLAKESGRNRCEFR
jgi:diguanylate cyclase (GGDEF)-like protein